MYRNGIPVDISWCHLIFIVFQTIYSGICQNQTKILVPSIPYIGKSLRFTFDDRYIRLRHPHHQFGTANLVVLEMSRVVATLQHIQNMFWSSRLQARRPRKTTIFWRKITAVKFDYVDMHHSYKMKCRHIDLMEWPSRSPDVNPIERVHVMPLADVCNYWNVNLPLRLPNAVFTGTCILWFMQGL